MRVMRASETSLEPVMGERRKKLITSEAAVSSAKRGMRSRALSERSLS